MPDDRVPIVVVLDDDPTGTQTVHDVPVLTEWSPEGLAAEFAAPGRCCYILTNTRALSREEAAAINRQIGRHLLAASARTRRPFRVVSRSDSTLRGHFPAETDALGETLGPFDATLVIPAFFEGGRRTAADIHYVGNVPVAETEFARDPRFGFRSSNLREWVQEKSGGRIRAGAVASLALGQLRGPPAALAAALCGLRGGGVAVVNAEQPDDLRALASALAQAETAGKRFLFRTAASFVAAYAGIEPRPLLRREEIAPPGAGRGLLIVGSHVSRSTEQLRRWSEGTQSVPVMLAAEDLLSSDPSPAIGAAAARITQALADGRTAALATSRTPVPGSSDHEHAVIARAISLGLVQTLAAVTARPRWIIAKGGITSSDIATGALGVRRALVLGQALPGVPVWRLGPESRWPGMGYLVFPGNVGDSDALLELTRKLG